MKTLAIALNALLLLFTSFVLATDGPPSKLLSWLITLWGLLTLALSIAAIARIREGDAKLRFAGLSSRNVLLRAASAVMNLVSLGFVCWALVDQYPHPNEVGFLEFVILTVVTHALNIIVLFLGGAAYAWRRQAILKKPAEQTE